MKLYGFPPSPNTWKVRAVAAHIGLPFDVQKAPVDEADVWADPSLNVYPARRVGPDPAGQVAQEQDA